VALKWRCFCGGSNDDYGRVDAAGPLQCIATSATLVGGAEDIGHVAKFSSDLFGERFDCEDIILGETVPIPDPSPKCLSRSDYALLAKAFLEDNAGNKDHFEDLGFKLAVVLPNDESASKNAARLLQRDGRATLLRKITTAGAKEVRSIADTIFNDLPADERVTALSDLVGLLLQATDPESGGPLLSARYHFFLRSLEGAFVAYWPRKQVFLERKADVGIAAAFEVAICRECGQHYLVGPKNFKGGKLIEATRDPGQPNFGATFFGPVENDEDENEKDEDGYDRALRINCFNCVCNVARWREVNRAVVMTL
jgi:hypothetical protein